LDETWVWAVAPFNPVPADGATVSSGDVLLEWILPEPNQPGSIVTCDVYWGTDPNIINNEKIIDNQMVESALVSADFGQVYYWQIITYQGGIKDVTGPVFTFNTLNQP
ncbi:hypothetical protein, partial [Cecembia sp.]|uniref:hypothetical protein n=1 Tax=Cecembia sp. TaxID=1898110 RepID=UPI0025BC1169